MTSIEDRLAKLEDTQYKHTVALKKQRIRIDKLEQVDCPSCGCSTQVPTEPNKCPDCTCGKERDE